ncbi:hypothetical protein BDV96DRAFT_599195 [Lophiotrema nucula]|uniref:Uncharacterized protein n=1 Tax=Lophiotrema nucula TaxID=690887 RepID=A0A6A5Z938_9PLEO|nr:hypothetical protein BDV96DRAFT_599195 [Lophiotrema nucula]
MEQNWSNRTTRSDIVEWYPKAKDQLQIELQPQDRLPRNIERYQDPAMCPTHSAASRLTTVVFSWPLKFGICTRREEPRDEMPYRSTSHHSALHAVHAPVREPSQRGSGAVTVPEKEHSVHEAGGDPPGTANGTYSREMCGGAPSKSTSSEHSPILTRLPNMGQTSMALVTVSRLQGFYAAGTSGIGKNG